MKRQTLNTGVAKRPTNKRPRWLKKRNSATPAYAKILAKIAKEAAVLVPEQTFKEGTSNPLGTMLEDTFSPRALFEAQTAVLSLLLERLDKDEWAVLNRADSEEDESHLEDLVRKLEDFNAGCLQNALPNTSHIHRHKAVFPFEDHD